MPVNVNPEYVQAEKEYLEAQTLEEKLRTLKNLISKAPHHKGAENLRQQLTTRRKRLQEQLAKSKKSGKGSYTGIKKEDMQVAIIGETNTGKSSLLSLLTNARPKISKISFTTKKPIIGMMNYEGINIQIIEIPSINSIYFDRGLANTADTILILVNKIEQIKTIKKELTKAHGKQIIIFNIIHKLNENEKRKLAATLQSKKYNFVLISTKTKEDLKELKDKILKTCSKIRVYTKEPGKEKSKRPIIMKLDSTVKDIAEKILKGFSKKVVETKIWGPSSKFSGQKVGLKHKLKDLDVVEFKTR